LFQKKTDYSVAHGPQFTLLRSRDDFLLGSMRRIGRSLGLAHAKAETGLTLVHCDVRIPLGHFKICRGGVNDFQREHNKVLSLATEIFRTENFRRIALGIGPSSEWDMYNYRMVVGLENRQKAWSIYHHCKLPDHQRFIFQENVRAKIKELLPIIADPNATYVSGEFTETNYVIQTRQH